MIIETTLNIQAMILTKINQAAQLSGTTRTFVIVTLMKKVMNETQNQVLCGARVRYQDRRKPDDWHTFHVQLKPDEYEYILDLRKLMKMSVSYILAYAVEKFIDELILKKDTDNYLYTNYVIVKDIIDDIICWKLIWGYPKNIR